ncbi:bile acid:sodium symporter family protein [Nocardia arizonensis]|uniref:bile acid:sodium symporter family protein n=1 Tax=Nocardia arizonensis TaxID=1141647 RepID=UPI0006D1C9BC|nr:bile acid:sodium symporter family protein [Nocardia arizonensis]
MADWPVTIALPIVLALIMFGLGLALTPADFARVVRYPRAAVIALTCQLAILPVLAFGLVVAVDPDPRLAVGVMLLAAAPGGATANLLSNLFRGDVALNVTLTAVNSVIAVVTMPLVANLALAYFAPAGTEQLGLQFTKVVQVFAIVLLPVGAGMLTRRLAPGFARGADRPVRLVSIGFLAALSVAAVIAERADAVAYLVDIGLVTLLLAAGSLGIGYWAPKAAGVPGPQAIACSMEIGIHNSALAMTIAIGVLDDLRMAIPAGVYAVVVLPVACAAGVLMSRAPARALPPARRGERT